MARLIVNIDVDDVEKAVGFYTSALGLRIGRRFGGGGVELVGVEAPIKERGQTLPYSTSPACTCEADRRSRS